MKKASVEDVGRLVELMAEFYGESRYPLHRERAAEAFINLLSHENLGHVWLIEADAQAVGYVVLTLAYSMEYGGHSAFVDDLFIQQAFRGAGRGRAALAEVRAFCASHGVRAMQLEVGRDNLAAQTVYRRMGFVDTDRQLLTLQLADPTHAT